MNEAVFSSMVARLTTKYLALWSATPDDPPDFRERFSSRHKSKMEKEFELLFRKVPVSRKAYKNMDEADRAKTRTRVKILVVRSLLSTSEATTSRFFDECEQSAEAFVKAAKVLDLGISEGDIRQALRNLWVFNSIQFYLDKQVSPSPSSIAYSLLYPITDNCLDSTSRSTRDKKSFLRWLTLRLKGKGPVADDQRAATLDGLIQMIEEQFPRPAFPCVYHSLFAIHRAQKNSLLLHNSRSSTGRNDLLGLTFEKGGTSVLADGFLVSRDLSPTDVNTVFGYGVLLQLIDDLQDLDEDGRNGYSTPFLRAIKAGTLTQTTNRLFNFTKVILALMGRQESAHCGQLGQIIEQSCLFLIREAIARYHFVYDNAYLRMIDSSTPVRLSYLGGIRQRLGRGFATSGTISLVGSPTAYDTVTSS